MTERKLTNLDIGDGLLHADERYCGRTLAEPGKKGFGPLKAPLPLTAEDAFRCASFGIAYEPTYATVTLDRDCPKTTIFGIPVRIDPDCQRGLGGYLFNPANFGRWRPRGDDTDFDPPIDDSRIRDILCWPPAYAPKNPYYQKNHVSAPGTVRSWFRKMRAADFERSVGQPVTFSGYTVVLRGLTVHVGQNEPWTLFDTQKVIDRETADTYFTYSGRSRVACRFVREDDARRPVGTPPCAECQKIDAMKDGP